MKKIVFKCENKDSEISGTIICILLFMVGWLVSAAIAREYGDSFMVVVLIPVAFLICGVFLVSKRKKSDAGESFAKFSDSGRVKLAFGGRSVIFDAKSVKKLSFSRNGMTNLSADFSGGSSYVLTIKLPFKTYKIFVNSDSGKFEDTELYQVYLELKQRMDAE